MAFETEDDAFNYLMNGEKPIAKAEGGLLTGDEPDQAKPAVSAPKVFPQSSTASEPTLVNDLGHYSEAIEQLKRLPQQKGTVGQFRKAIASKVSPEEFKWSNFDDHFTDENAKVDKSQLISHFRQNLPKLKETVRHEDNKWVSGAKIEDLAIKASENQEIYDKIFDHKGIGMPFDYHDTKGIIQDYVKRYLEKNPDTFEHVTGEPLKAQPKYADYQSPGSSNYREILLHVDHPETKYESSHWDEPNVLAHLRLNDHVGPNGEKLLHVEEAQSDWGQEARRNGILTPERKKQVSEIYDEIKSINQKMEDLDVGKNDKGYEDWENRYREYAKLNEQLYALQRKHNELDTTNVLPAPFIHNTSKWTELAMKRVLKEAAEGGYDGVTLSSGDEQKQRWRGAAGADGLKSFYDDVLPKTLEKVAKVHDKDAKVASTAEMSTSEYEKLPDHKKAERLSEKLGVPMYGQEALDWFSGLHPTTKRDLIAKVGGDANPRPFLPVTPALKASVKRGQRMFKDGGGIKDTLTQDAYHFTNSDEFPQFKNEIDEHTPISTAIGTHIAKDPKIASNFFSNEEMEDFDRPRIMPLKVPKEDNFLAIPQKGDKPHDEAIEDFVKTIVRNKNPLIYKNFSLGNDLSSKEKGVKTFINEIRSRGYSGIKYQNNHPVESAGAKDKTCFVVFPHDESVPDMAPIRGRFAAFSDKDETNPQIMRASGGNVNANPTPAQIEAGNYKKRHDTFQGLNIAIENEKGASRSGTDATGRRWSVKMPAAYGYIKGSVGADKDHVDCYVGNRQNSPVAFIINQLDLKTSKFDEHKCMLGFSTKAEAEKVYKAGFSDGRGGDRLGSIHELTMPEFRAWLKTGKTKTPYTNASQKLVEKALNLTNGNRSTAASNLNAAKGA